MSGSATGRDGVRRRTEGVGEFAGPALRLDGDGWAAGGEIPRGASRLVAAVTTPGPRRDHDFALFGSAPTREVLPRWMALAAQPGVAGVVHARQVHEAAVLLHRDPGPGLHLVGEADGHLTRTPGLLLTVSIADCVPVFLVDLRTGGLGLLHSGWRSSAAGILERGIERLVSAFGTAPEELVVHFGPSISGERYEVGPEVFEALGEEVPDGPTPIDLREVLARRAIAAGVPASHISVSTHCTLAGDADLFSHRGGDAGRQIAVLGWLDGGAAG